MSLPKERVGYEFDESETSVLRIADDTEVNE